jgi:hypothetical protein
MREESIYEVVLGKFNNFTTVRHRYPWVPTNQASVVPNKVGSAYQKTHQPVNGPNQLSWWPT